MTEPREIDVDELAERLAEGVVVIDVREADEYDSGHVPGALFVPLSELEQRVDEVPSGEPVLVICKSGGRSMRACNFLAPLGRDVTNIAGGTMAWIDSGRDVVTGMERG
ncbi:MAG TPA: rhodanese-like domain-containing protein [Microthrixaceae bacterium]|jgi:rhodanese-related sulfurtransferase|nr:rhodanese-like domain-containing protein [Microthrixaceae bacterium]HQF94910.1 rhodanese-like domain-containing protein [Microthrixaceae bacterium]